MDTNEERGLGEFGFDTLISAEGLESIEAIPIGHDGNPLPRIPGEEIDHGKATRTNGFFSILRDLEDALETIDRLTAMPRDGDIIVKQALFSSIIIYYGRSFASAKGRGTVLPSTKPWITDEQEQRWHSELMGLRNKLIAHVDETPYRQTKAVIVVDSLERISRINVMCTERTLGNVGEEDLRNIRNHVAKLAARVHNRYHTLLQLLGDAAKEKLKSRLI